MKIRSLLDSAGSERSVLELTALALLLFPAILYFSALQPAQRETEVLRREHRAALMHLKQMSDARPRTVPEQISDFYAALPDAGRKQSETLAQLAQIAQDSGVSFAQGTYQLTRVDGTRLLRYEIALPVNGGYAQIRAFLAKALNDMPYVALAQIAFERPRIADARIEARVKLVLYLKRDASARASVQENAQVAPLRSPLPSVPLKGKP